MALAYEESVGAVRAMSVWYEALDGKTVAVFSVSSLVAALAPKVGVQNVTWWLLALVAWMVSAVACFVAFFPRDFRFDPKPKVLMNEAWLKLDPVDFRRYRLADVAETYRINSKAYRFKVRTLSIAIGATAIEVLLLAIALFRSPG